MGGQFGGGVDAQGLGRGAGKGTGDDRVADQALVAGDVLADDDRGVGDRRMGRQHGFDLAEFNPEAAQLDLLVGAAEVLQDAVRAAAGEVAGAVHPGAPLAEQFGVRVGDEAGGSEFGAAEVAAGQTRPGDVHLAGDSGRDGLEVLVEDVDPQVGDVDADGAAAGRGGARPVEGEVGDVHGGLGDAVHVDQGRRVLGVPGVPVVQPGQFERLAAEHHVAQGEFAAGALPVGGAELVERGRGLVEHGDPLAGEQVEEGGRVAADQVRDDDQPAAVQQGAPQFPDREVEGVGVEEGPDVLGVEAEPVVGGAEQPGDVAVGDGHALGPAGGAGGVDDVRGVLGAQRAGAFVLGERGGRVRRRLRSVDQESGDGVGGQPGRGGPVGEHGGGGGVGQHVGQAVGRVVGVEREVGGAGLGDREQGDDQVDRAGQGEGDDGAGADAVGGQQTGQPVGAGAEFGVVESVLATTDGYGTRVGGGRGLEQLGQGGGRYGGGRCGDGPCGGGRCGGGRYGGGRCLGDRGAVPLDQGAPAFLRADQRQSADRGVRVGGGGGEQPGEAVREGGRGGGVEEVGAVLQEAADAAAGLLPRVEGEVELGGAAGDRGDLGGQTAAERGGFVDAALPGEHHLEQRVAGERAGRVELLDQAVEGQVGVLVGGQHGAAHAPEQFPEGRVAGRVGAQHHGVDEVADQRGALLVLAPGERGADGDVGAAAVPGEQGGEAGLDSREHGAAGGPGERGEGGVRLGAEGEGHGGAVVAGHGRAGAVGGQVELVGQAGEGGAPVLGLPYGERGRGVHGAEQLPLPGRVVGELDGERCEFGRVTGVPGGVGGGEVVQQRGGGGAVARDVVEQQEQGVPLGAVAEQRGAQRRFGGEVEGVPDGLGHLSGAVAEFDRRGGQDPLVRRAVRLLAVDGAQDFVPGGEVAEGEGEGGAVERAGEGEGERDVVGGAGAFEPVQEPEAALGG